jgi:hypothetical protein
MEKFARDLTPETAKAFLVRAGIVTPGGRLTRSYR